MDKAAKRQYKALPKSIRIGQRNFKIVLSSEDVDAGLQDAFAYTMKNFDTIVLGNTMSAGHLRSTLLHEILHAIGVVYRNTDSHGPTKEEDEPLEHYKGRWEHFFIFLLSEPLTQILRDNPKLVEFFTLKEEGDEGGTP